MQYLDLANLYESLGNTSKRLDKTYKISALIKKTDASDLTHIMLLIQGKVFPDWDDKKIGVASKLVVKAICKATGISLEKIEEEWKKQGDLGSVAQSLIEKRKQSSLLHKDLTVNEVYDKIRKLASMEGKGSVDEKLGIISDMLIHASPLEAKYIARTILDNMRIGIGKGSIRDAIVWAFFSEMLGISYNKDNDIIVEKREEYNEILEKVQHAFDMTNDFGTVAVNLKEKGISSLDGILLKPGSPVNVMLFQKAKDINEAFELVGKPASFEYKYDGFRMQIHLSETVKIFTRRLEEVTSQFPEVAAFIKENIHAKSCILDGEAVGFDPKTGKYIPFQKISQRIKRKYLIEEMAKDFPIEINLFDILFCNGESMLNVSFRKRREELAKITVQKKQKIVLSKQIITSDGEEADNFYKAALAEGQEGLMAKNLEGLYMPGSRVGFGVKIKPVMEPLDLVIVAAEYGEGKRSGWLTSFYLACSDDGVLKQIGKVSTGLKELDTVDDTSFKDLTNLLKPLVKKSAGKYVELKPEIVIEVAYEEIQASPSYSSGYALRFPRFLRLRNDEKTVKDINTLSDVEKLYNDQRGRGIKNG